MKTKRTLFIGILFLLGGLLHGGGAFAAYVQSIGNGSWSDPGIWSTGVVPGSQDDVDVKHRISKSGPTVVHADGRITVVAGGTLVVSGPFANHGIVIAHDSLVVEGFSNDGILENYGAMTINGNLENLNIGAITNYGTITIQGNFSNRWKVENSGFFKINGNVDNYLALIGPAGTPNYFEVCGNVTHHNTGIITGNMYLCLRCGGHYDVEPGHTGEFLLTCSPFAAEIQYFAAELAGDGSVHLQWVSQSESNCDWYIVERSSDFNAGTCKIGKCGSSQTFNEIGRVKAAGNSTVPLNYTFIDAHPLQGNNYYRLRIVDKGGAITYSGIVAVPVEQQKITLLAFPNPSNSILHIQANGNLRESSVLSLFSIDGKLVWERKLDPGLSPYRYDMQICDFSDGVYLLRFVQGRQEEVRKLVFMKSE